MTPLIAILGAGPAGLMLARLLTLAKISYKIFERDTSALKANDRASSGTLDIHAGSGQCALQQAGLFEDFKRLARWNATTVIAEPDGNVLARMAGNGEEDRPEIDRRDLRRLLLGSVPKEKIVWDSRVRSVGRGKEGGMEVRFFDGRVEGGFRLVVGADGASSKVREVVTSSKPEFSGLYYLTTNIAPGNPVHGSAKSLAGDGNYMVFGGEKMMATMKLDDDSYYTIVGMRLPESWKKQNAAMLNDPRVVRQWLLREQLTAFSKTHRDLIEHSEGPFFVWPLYGMPLESLSWKTVSGVTLLGDAAHLTPPSGEGVNHALHDSVELAHHIIKHGLEDLDGAVSEYEQSMQARAIKHSKKSAMMNSLFFAPEGARGMMKAFGMGAGDADKK